LYSQISVCVFVRATSLVQSLKQALDDFQFTSYQVTSDPDFWSLLKDETHQIDCLILQSGSTLSPLFDELRKQNILLPTIVISGEDCDRPHSDDPQGNHPAYEGDRILAESRRSREIEESLLYYHAAVVRMGTGRAQDLENYIHQAIDQFLSLPKGQFSSEQVFLSGADANKGLMSQQSRLIEKLRERLGYLGVYYKRNPNNFLRNMPQVDQQKILDKLGQDYRTIILNYFSDDTDINQKIDAYVDAAFLADISVSQIVEIHMNLMDEFSKQLQLEGRGEEILLDYRLTLIDVIAHLCEMYRRSIPRSTIGPSD